MNDESDREQISQPVADERAHQGSAAAHARAARRRAQQEFQRSESRLQSRTGAAGSSALPGVRQTNLHGQLPRGREGEGVRGTDCGRRFPGRRREDSRRQCAAGCYGTSLPAGRSLRRQVPAVEESEAARHRLSGALCRRLRAAHGHACSAQRATHRKESCGRGQRAVGPHRGR